MPSCFVDYRRAECFYEDARDFQHCLLKNVEAQVVIANRIGETVCLDDYELRSIMFQKCNTVYRVSGPKDLNNTDFVNLARTLKYDFGASNAQLSRILNKPQSQIDQIYPVRPFVRENGQCQGRRDPVRPSVRENGQFQG